MIRPAKNNGNKRGSAFSSEKKEKSSLFYNLRINLLVFLVIILGGAILVRLYSLQVVAFQSYRAMSDDQHFLEKNLVPERGEIFMNGKDGIYPVAVNKQTKMAFAVPKEVEDPAATARSLAPILGLEEAALRERLDKPESMYTVIKHRLSDEEIGKINGLKLKGIHLSEEAYRYYPAGELASNVIGFVGWRDRQFGGRYGLEAYFNEELTGTPGRLMQNSDTAGRWIPVGEKDIVQAKNGDSLVLTIDHIVQYETEKILKSAVEKFQGDGGTIIVMEPETGRILSMATYPTFDPNNFAQVEDMGAFRNLAVNDAYEPGSIFKTFTLAAADDSGKITPDTTYNDTGTVHEAGYSIKNSDLKSYGKQTMTQVLEKSLNTGAIFAQKSIGNKNFADYVRRFGFGETTGISLLGESPGNINNLKNLKSDIQFYTASFGQGITTTPLQLISAYSVIANGGVLMKPQIIDEVIHSDGTKEAVQPQEIRRVLSERAARDTAQMLRSVVTEGHGKRADVPGYLVGGKTGTAQVASTETKGYEEGKSVGSFAGFAPVDNPKFAILVRINDPKTVEWAESSAAPTFGELMRFILNYYGIEPTEEYTQKDLDQFDATHTLSEYFMKKEEDSAQPEEDMSDPPAQAVEKEKDKKKR